MWKTKRCTGQETQTTYLKLEALKLTAFKF